MNISENVTLEIPPKLLPFKADCDFLFTLWQQELEILYPELTPTIDALVKNNSGANRIKETDSHSLYIFSHAISTLFQLYNLAEEQHRTRRLKFYETQPQNRPEPGTFSAWFANAKELSAWSKLGVRIVFTAHPTELRRPAVIRQWNRLSDLLMARELAVTEHERQHLEQAIREPIRTLLTTGDVRNAGVTPFHEIRDLWAQLGVLWGAVGLLHTKAGRLFSTEKKSNVQLTPPLRFGCWVGVDADGNPNITPDTMRYAAENLRRMALSYYLTECESLLAELTMSRDLLDFPPEMFVFIAKLEAKIPNHTAELGNHYGQEPFRRAIALIIERLRDTLFALPEDKSLTGYDTVRTVESRQIENSYLWCEEFEAEVMQLAEFVELTLHYRNATLETLLFRAKTFGFHFCSLEHRFHANELKAALLALHPNAGANIDDLQLWKWVVELFISGKSIPSIKYPEIPVFERLEAVKEIRERYGTTALDTIILSGTSRLEELFGLALLVETLELDGADGAPLQIVPLFETIPDLTNAPAIMNSLLASPRWKARLARLEKNTQEIMLGYSDSGKDGGIVASTLGLHKATQALFAVGKKRNTGIQFFHGRGGTVARGGGPLYQSIVATPESVGDGCWKLTEQGEMIATRYSHPELAERVFEQMLVATLDALTKQNRGSLHPTTFDTIAPESERAWRDLVYETDGFPDFFRSISPIRELGALRIGSRPAKRIESNRIEDLRAIPWAFAWLQNRLNLPGWYGFGSAIESLHRDNRAWETIKKEFANEPILQLLLTKLSISIALTDWRCTEQFFTLSDDSCQLIRTQIETELSKTKIALGEITAVNPLRAYTLFQVSLDLRRSWLHTLANIQTELLRRYRVQEGLTVETMLQKAILQSVIAVAAGIRNSG